MQVINLAVEMQDGSQFCIPTQRLAQLAKEAWNIDNAKLKTLYAAFDNLLPRTEMESEYLIQQGSGSWEAPFIAWTGFEYAE